MTEILDPPPMSPAKAVATVIGLPLIIAALAFGPAGTFGWGLGWAFLAVTAAAGTAASLVIGRRNPVIFRARSRIQPGTEAWDLVLVKILVGLIAAIIPVSAFDATHLREAPLAREFVLLGYGLYLAGFAGLTWAQLHNPFFEPGVRLQRERGQHVVDTGPYRIVRHPGYATALGLCLGMPLALGSLIGLVPAVLGIAVLVIRTAWEDRLLRSGLDGYEAYAARTRWRILPGVW